MSPLPTTNFWVAPKIAVAARTVKLSTSDQYVPKQWLIRILFFPLTGSSTPEQVYSHLREGLSRTLVQLPFLTGHICRQPEGRQHAAVRIEENSAVEFIFKNHGELEPEENGTFPAYAKLKEKHFPMRFLAERAVPKSFLLPVAEGSIVFAAQANFMPGGLALTIGISHVLADAEGWANLTRLWARNTADAARGEGQKDIVELAFDETRQRLSEGTPSSIELDRLTWTIGEVSQSPLHLPLPITQQSPTSQRTSPSLSSWRIWYFSHESLKKLKHAATAGNEVDWVSTMDALFALFWHRTSPLRDLGSRGHQKCICRIPISLHTRMQPPIAADYVGNAVYMMSIEASIAELEPPQGANVALPAIARKIRRSVNNFDVGAIGAFFRVADSLPLDKALRHPSMSAVEPNILMNDHSKLRLYDLDWGNGVGPLESVRGPEPDFPFAGLALCIAFPKFSDGGIEVATVFGNEVNEKLAKDEIFKQYAELRYPSDDS